MITELTQWRDHLGAIGDDEELPKTHPRKVVATTLGYVENNRSRMNYAQYRREGLPTMSGLVESLIKQFNYRVKGTEKSWVQKNAESILQVRAAVLSEDERFEKHMGNRACPQFGAIRRLSRIQNPRKARGLGKTTELQTVSSTHLAWHGNPREPRAGAAWLAGLGVRDPERGASDLADLTRRAGPERLERVARIAAQLDAVLPRCPDPGMALTNLDRSLAAVPPRRDARRAGRQRADDRDPPTPAPASGQAESLGTTPRG